MSHHSPHTIRSHFIRTFLSDFLWKLAHIGTPHSAHISATVLFWPWVWNTALLKHFTNPPSAQNGQQSPKDNMKHSQQLFRHAPQASQSQSHPSPPPPMPQNVQSMCGQYGQQSPPPPLLYGEWNVSESIVSCLVTWPSDIMTAGCEIHSFVQ